MLSSSGILVAALLSLAAAVSIWPGAGLVAVARLQRVSAPAHSGSESLGDVPSGARALLFAGLAGASVLVTFPSLAGSAAAAGTSLGVHFLLLGSRSTDGFGSRHMSPWSIVRSLGGRPGDRTEADQTLPFAIDLLAVCMRAGLPTSTALRSVAAVMADITDSRRALRPATRAGAAPGVQIVLGRAAAAAELGTAPASAWREWIGHPVYGPLARAMIVTGESGSAVAGRLESVARQLRNAAGQQAIAQAQRVGVALMAPLGLCFLPAFVCLGVVPVVVGIAGRVFG